MLIYVPSYATLIAAPQSSISIGSGSRILNSAFHHMPYVIALICTQIFYMINPCHPSLVRKLAMSYLTVIISAVFLLGFMGRQ
jgi:hypothetical protein